MLMARFFRELLTSSDNHTFELGRALWALSVIALLAFQGVAIVMKGQAFNPVEFGAGVAAILAAGGFGIAAKDKVAKAPDQS